MENNKPQRAPNNPNKTRNRTSSRRRWWRRSERITCYFWGSPFPINEIPCVCVFVCVCRHQMATMFHIIASVGCLNVRFIWRCFRISNVEKKTNHQKLLVILGPTITGTARNFRNFQSKKKFIWTNEPTTQKPWECRSIKVPLVFHRLSVPLLLYYRLF